MSDTIDKLINELYRNCCLDACANASLLFLLKQTVWVLILFIHIDQSYQSYA